MIKELIATLENLEDVAQELGDSVNRCSRIGNKPGNVKVIDITDTDEIALIYNYENNVEDDGREISDIDERKKFLLTTSVTKANIWEEEVKAEGYEIGKPFIFSKTGELVIFMAAGLPAVDNVGDEDGGYPFE